MNDPEVIYVGFRTDAFLWLFVAGITLSRVARMWRR